MGEMQTLAKELIASPAESSILHEVEASITAAEEWRGACRRLMVKKHTGDSLKHGLEVMADSLDKFLDILQRDKARKPANANGPPAPETPEMYSYDPTLCPCTILGGAEEKGKNPTILCQECNCNFHLRCLGLSQATAKSLKELFTCNFCASVKECKFSEVLDVHDTFFTRSRRMRRVNAVELENLASQLGNLKCSMPEEFALRQLLTKVQPVHDTLKCFVDRHSQVSQEDGRGPTSPVKLLMVALRVSLALEVNLGEKLQPLLQALYAQDWLAQVRPELDAKKVSCLSKVEEIIMDARTLGISKGVGNGNFVADLEDRLERAREWKRQVVAVTADLSIPMDDAKKVLEQAAGLGIEMPEELEAMEERCSLYCICRLPYDQARDMIECEKCGGWFHYDCVGLESPQEDSGKHGITEKEGLQFSCPPCTAGLSLEEWKAEAAPP